MVLSEQNIMPVTCLIFSSIILAPIVIIFLYWKRFRQGTKEAFTMYFTICLRKENEIKIIPKRELYLLYICTYLAMTYLMMIFLISSVRYQDIILGIITIPSIPLSIYLIVIYLRRITIPVVTFDSIKKAMKISFRKAADYEQIAGIRFHMPARNPFGLSKVEPVTFVDGYVVIRLSTPKRSGHKIERRLAGWIQTEIETQTGRQVPVMENTELVSA